VGERKKRAKTKKRKQNEGSKEMGEGEKWANDE
jgi:hypothetical protein